MTPDHSPLDAKQNSRERVVQSADLPALAVVEKSWMGYIDRGIAAQKAGRGVKPVAKSA